MWNDTLHQVISILRRKIGRRGLAILVIFNICYLITFLIRDCVLLGGRESMNFTGYLICVLSEQHFLTFAATLSIIFGINEMHALRLTEALTYKTQGLWTKAMLLSGIVYSLVYVLFLLSMMAILALVSGIDFSDLQTPCRGMDWLIPHILYNGEQTDVLKLAAANVGNVLCYCITTAVMYSFLLSVVKERAAAVMIETGLFIIALMMVKMVVLWSYPFIPLGNVILSMNENRWNDGVNWPYWFIVNSALVAGTFYRIRKREFCHDV